MWRSVAALKCWIKIARRVHWRPPLKFAFITCSPCESDCDYTCDAEKCQSPLYGAPRDVLWSAACIVVTDEVLTLINFVHDKDVYIGPHGVYRGFPDACWKIGVTCLQQIAYCKFQCACVLIVRLLLESCYRVCASNDLHILLQVIKKFCSCGWVRGCKAGCTCGNLWYWWLMSVSLSFIDHEKSLVYFRMKL